MKKLDEIEQLRERVAVLEGRADALSIVLHSSIIMTEDVVKRHSASILDMISTFAEKHPNPHAKAVLLEWGQILNRSD